MIFGRTFETLEEAKDFAEFMNERDPYFTYTAREQANSYGRYVIEMEEK